MLPKLLKRNPLRGITPWQFSVRVALIAFAVILTPALILVAAPVAFFLVPIAVLVLPFLIPALSSEAGHPEDLPGGHGSHAHHHPKLHG